MGIKFKTASVLELPVVPNVCPVAVINEDPPIWLIDDGEIL